MYPVISVNSRCGESLEPLGAKRKFWYRDGRRRMLFKAEERGTGEDWAERIACELCALLGLPHVHYELALDVHSQWPGVICETCAPPPMALALGNQLLLARDPHYPADDARKYKVREHTVDAVAAVLQTLRPPPVQWLSAAPSGIVSAIDVFVGCAMLDAWIANQDRHHQNWGAIRIEDALYLAPTFDHGASMARNLSDDERSERMTTRDSNRKMPAFVRRARSGFYATAADAKSMTTLQAYLAFSHRASTAATIWLERLERIDGAAVDQLLEQVPPQRMSNICRSFTKELLIENRERLLAGESV
ncbi:MAG TPA: hypothetical protein VFC78_06190 [Tepidisphaeraceae bacterium]|nr:hypothetical protein [Tepidisphaeraceae bacterium]